MTILSAVRRKCRSATTLTLAAIACLGLVATPCAIVFLPASPVAVPAAIAEVPDHCLPAETPKAMDDSAWSCHLTTVATGDVFQPAKVETFDGQATDFELFTVARTSIVAAAVHDSRPRGAQVPVYLATHRLRI